MVTLESDHVLEVTQHTELNFGVLMTMEKLLLKAMNKTIISFNYQHLKFYQMASCIMIVVQELMI